MRNEGFKKSLRASPRYRAQRSEHGSERVVVVI